MQRTADKLRTLFSEWDVYTTVLLGFILFLILFRVHNVLAFNPFWGYDGGGHIDYVMQLAQHNRMPDIATNYIAWHEPIYYFFQAGIAKIAFLFTDQLSTVLKTLRLVQVILSFIVTFLTYHIIRLVTTSRAVILFSFILVNLMPAMTQASTFLTNELLNYAFIFLLLYLLLRFFIKQRPRPGHYLLLGITSGLALNNKITAVIKA